MSTNKSLQNKYTEFKRNIRKAMKNNQLALFIGAGVSINSGMPSWQNAVETIGKRLGIEQVANTDFLKIPQYYYNANGKQAYNSLMQEIFKYRVELPISSIHKKLLKFNAQTIITTNYDKLIERASEEKGEIRHVICQDSDIPYIKNNKQLIKMHGDFDHDNFVLKEDDYLNYSSNFKLIENYVRSIIGSKVILFVGYSFNDPDLKQIFSWVKNILGKDMRKAYLINAENEYNENEANYYNNFGLDVIYVSAWDPKNFNKSGIDKNLEIALDRLLSNSEDTDPIERIYADLKKFENLRYITTKYLNNTLAKYGLRISSDLYLQSIDNSSENILPLLFSKQENIDNDKKRKITRIQNLLSRSIIKGVIIDKKVIEFKNSSKEDNWQKAFYTFDIPALKKIKNKNELSMNDNDGELLLEQATIAYYLDEFLLSFEYLKRASKSLFKNKSYSLFFIAQVNLKKLGKFIIDDRCILRIDDQTAKLIKSEVDNIDINEIIENISDLKVDERLLVEDIKQFNFSYSSFQKLYKLNIKSDEEASKKFTLFIGMPAYAISRVEIKDFFNFETKNFLLFEKYQEIQETYKLYVRTIIASAFSEDLTDVADPMLPEKNIHLKYLNDLDIFLIIKYFHDSDISTLFDAYYKGSPIDINSEGLEYLETIVPNIIKSKFKIYQKDDLYWRLIALGGYIKLNRKIVKTLLAIMPEKITEHAIATKNRILQNFLVNIKNQELISQQETVQLNKISQNILEFKNKFVIENNDALIFYINRIILDVDKSYDNKDIINKCLSRNLDSILMNLFGLSSKNSKNKIKNYFRDRNFNDSIEDYIFRMFLVDYDILKFNIELENRIVEKIKNRNQRFDEVHERPNKIVILTNKLVELYLQDKTYNNKAIREIINKYATPVSKWLIRYQNFDYEHFDVNWLSECSKYVINKISSDKDVKHKIKSRLIQAFKENKLTTELEKIYFNYFSD